MSIHKSISIGGISPERIVKDFGSPLYAYDEDDIRTRCRELQESFPGMDLYYACKANTNPEIIKIIFGERFGVETVSPGEISVAEKAGVPVRRMTFTCGSIDEQELVSIARKRIRIHLDSLHQVEVFGRHFPGKEISVRLNQGIGAGHHAHVITGGPDSKFGIDVSHIARLKKLARKHRLRITGLHQHIGSNILDASIFLKAMAALFSTAFHFPHLENLDFGGGFGVPYGPGERALNLGILGKKVQAIASDFAERYGRPVAMSFEPGRYLVARAGYLIVKVNDIKRNPEKTFVGVNSGFNHLIRPAMYGSYHEIVNATHPERAREQATIAGNMCESGDVFARDRRFPMPRLGDILVIKNAGAYGYTMSSDYNLRPRPREILISKRKARVIKSNFL